MTTNVEINAGIANDLNELCTTLNRINDQYPRRVGTMVMVSDDTENQIEDIVNQIDGCRAQLADLSDEEIGEFTDDVQGYRDFLDRLVEIIAANREEIQRARVFLSRYYSR